MQTVFRFVLLGALLLLSPSTANAYPDTLKFQVSVANGAGRTVQTTNGRYLGVLSPSGSVLSIVDTATFSVLTTFSFSSAPVGIVASTSENSFYVVTSSTDGLFEVQLSGTPDEFVANSFADLNTESSFIDVTVESDLVFLLAEERDRIYVFDPSTGALNESKESISLSIPVDHLIAVEDRNRVLGLNEDGRILVIDTTSLNQIGGIQDFENFTNTGSAMYPDIVTGTPSGTLVTGFVPKTSSSGETFAFQLELDTPPITVLDADPGSGGVNPISVGNTPAAVHFDTVNDPEDGESETAPYLFIADQGNNTLSFIDVDEFFDADTEVVVAENQIELSGTPFSGGMTGQTESDGYLFVSLGNSGMIDVVTENPLITITAAPPAETTGDEFSFSFVSDSSGDYQVRLLDQNDNEAVSKSSGTLLVEGSLAADETVVVEVNSSDFNDGLNRIVIFVESGSLTGRKGFVIDASVPPPAPDDFKLDFGDQKIFVSFKSVEGNIDFYRIYFGLSKNNLDGAGTLSSPQEVEHPGEADVKVEEELGLLPNGSLIFVQVAAVNSAGIEGERTEFLSETPEQTIGILDLISEEGGCGAIQKSVSTLPGLVWLLLTITLVMILIKRRARKQAPYFFFLIFTGMMVFSLTTPGLAQDTQEKAASKNVEPHQSKTPAMLLAFRVQWWLPSQGVVDRFYGGIGNEIYSLRVAFPILVRFGSIEPFVEGGFMFEKARLVGATSGRPSGEKGELSLYPLRFGSQIVINPSQQWAMEPLVSAAYSAVLYKLEEENVSVDGTKHAISARTGFRLLLEKLSGDEEGWQSFMGLRSGFFSFVGGIDIPVGQQGLKLHGFSVGPEVGIIF